ncbi:prepilin peptidase [Streptacidiphilus jiangxiensis]|uniref:Type IV leader peptidase family protein n=1 Tax=Streptacidiphilus jiangxiensis TaxID=235985 RepID=A0A1H7G765_STRJI|nr:A24 family peptidase [Streptacidiphilus jiangxiensis]SEK33307.1 Type IV leader peptidase family protein [Streptacidiphilus jiangxiensis]
MPQTPPDPLEATGATEAAEAAGAAGAAGASVPAPSPSPEGTPADAAAPTDETADAAAPTDAAAASAARPPRLLGVFPAADAETRAVLRRDAVPIGLGALLAVGGLVVREGFSLLMPAHAAFAVLAAALTALDLRLRRLPDALTLPALPVLLALLALPGDGSALLRALLAALVLIAAYYVLAFFGGAGFGDVKAAGAVGLVLGFTGWHAVLAGTLYASLLAAVLAVVLLASRKASRRTQIPFGPFMTVGALLALLL